MKAMCGVWLSSAAMKKLCTDVIWLQETRQAEESVKSGDLVAENQEEEKAKNEGIEENGVKAAKNSGENGAGTA